MIYAQANVTITYLNTCFIKYANGYSVTDTLCECPSKRIVKLVEEFRKYLDYLGFRNV